MTDLSISPQNLMLQRVKIAAQASLSEEAIHSTVDVEQYMDHIMRRLVLALRTEMLAEKVLDTNQEISFQGTTTRTLPDRIIKLQWTPLALGVPATLVAALLSNIPLGIFAGLMIVLGLYLWGASRPKPITEELPVSGKVVVPATYWRAFPQATIQYPDDLGPYVIRQIMGEAHYYDH